MKYARNHLLAATTLALAHWGLPAHAEATTPTANSMEEVSDAELGDMRGRYTVSGNTVAWFGVKMISTWQSNTGQVLESTLAVNMKFDPGKVQPTVTFQPTVSITRADAPLPATPSATPSRSVDGSGLANVGGVVQSVQVAGDGNVASNVTRLSLLDGDSAPTPTTSATPFASATDAGASAVASFDGQSAHVLLTIEGQGAVAQWIRNGSVGQSVQLTADNQWVSNRMEIELVQQAVAGNAQLAQSVAQAITLARGVGTHY
ncbi:MAG: hypothetical protein WC617_02150 [Rhodanobacter sp.]|jgi:hypothetical protein